MSFGGENVSDYVNRIILETVGTDKLDEFNRGLDRNAAGATQAGRSLATMSVSVGQASSQMGEMAQSLDRVEKAQRRATAATEDAAKASKNFNYAAIELSRGLEDLAVAGPLGALNNVARFAEILGGPGGVAAGVSLAATAAYLLYKNWGLVNEALGTAATKTEAERMEELGRSTHKTAEEQREFNRLKREQGEIERLQALRSQAEKDTKKAVEDVIGEAGGLDKIAGPLAATRIARGVRTFETPEDIELRRKRDEVVKRIALGGDDEDILETSRVRLAYLNRKIGQRDAEIEAQRVQQARKDIIEAQTEPGKLGALIREVEEAPKAFPSGLAGRLIEATPEEREKQLALKLEGEQQAKAQLKRSHELAKARADEQREKERVERETEQSLEGMRVKSVADKERAEREHAQQVARLTTQYGGGLAADARPAALRRMAAGQTPDQIKAQLAPQISSILGQTPGFPAEDADAVAQAVVDKVLATIGRDVAGAGGRGPTTVRRAAGALLNRDLVKGARGERREATQEGGEARGAEQLDYAREIQNRTGATNASALAASKHTLALVQQGLDRESAIQAGWAQQLNHINRLLQVSGMMDGNVKRLTAQGQVRRPSPWGDFQ